MHKFKVKRNSWPKTRGVAMNPVDHVCVHPSAYPRTGLTCALLYSLTVVATINISARLRPSLGTRHRVKRPVSSRPEEPVSYAVLKRPRNKGAAWEVLRVLDGADIGCIRGTVMADLSSRCLRVATKVSEFELQCPDNFQCICMIIAFFTP